VADIYEPVDGCRCRGCAAARQLDEWIEGEDEGEHVHDTEAELAAITRERDQLAARVVDLAAALDEVLHHFAYEGHTQGKNVARTGWVPVQDVEAWRDVCYGKGKHRGK
jgi:hypothetical protein